MKNTKKPSILFDFLNSISYTKNDILEEYGEKEYNPYMINRWLSMRPDTIMYAQEMNQRPHLPKTMQYDYYMHSIKRIKRYFNYTKVNKDNEDLKCISEYYNISLNAAKSILHVHSPDEIKIIKEKLNKGGYE